LKKFEAITAEIADPKVQMRRFISIILLRMTSSVEVFIEYLPRFRIIFVSIPVWTTKAKTEFELFITAPLGKN